MLKSRFNLCYGYGHRSPHWADSKGGLKRFCSQRPGGGEWRPHKVSKHSRGQRQRLCFVWRPKQLILCLENKPGIRWKRQRMQQLHAHAKAARGQTLQISSIGTNWPCHSPSRNAFGSQSFHSPTFHIPILDWKMLGISIFNSPVKI